ncbi:MAG: FMN-binding negative transcriptional regulator [Candidatus Rokuibacteriota bacterium]
MIFHDYYADVPTEEVERFVGAQELGRLVTVGADGTPHLGLYPFVRDGQALDLHLVRHDEQVADLEVRPRCVFEVDEVLAVIPSDWVHAEYAGAATAYHRTVIFECQASLSADPAAVAAQQVRLLARYQPEGGFRPLEPSDPLYRGALAQLAAVRLTIGRVRTKFKLGQNRPPDTRRRVIEHLKARGRPADGRAAEALEWTLTNTPRDGRRQPADVQTPVARRNAP